MPPRVCIACGRHAVPGTSRCEAHTLKGTWRKSPAMRARASFYNDPAWKARSARQLKEFPTCVVCGAPATIADHIFARGLGGDPDGPLQSMCKPHHDEKTRAEGRAMLKLKAAERKRRRQQ